VIYLDTSVALAHLLAAPVRTLDALHLASAEFLRRRGQPIELATYDERLLAAAQSLGVPIAVV